MSEARVDDVDTAPSPSFKGGLNQYIYKSPSKPGARDVLPGLVPSPKRKLDEISDDADSAAQSSKSSTPTTATTTATRASIRLTRSKSSQLASLSALQTTRTTTSRRSRFKPSNNERSDNVNVDDDATPSLAAVAATGMSRLRDTIPPGLVLLLIGVNPGIMTGQTGYVYAHPSNLYWKLLHHSGITTHRHPPSDTYRLPDLYGVGNTNIVARATKDASMLSRAEMQAGVSVLEEKVAKGRPDAVCLVGKSIWETVWKVRKGRNIKKHEFRYGWQDESENMGKVLSSSGEDGWAGARVFVATTTSGLAASMSMAEKQAVWREVGDWVKKRRAERGISEPSLSEALGVQSPP